ncbi:hypothetical protein Cgig2_015670 [Carnegiea gigantea]|uniref:Uncharacterized protein n=1 Tax=Carnegiea gigantea TaxID=171969 RepID=A0A9Q1JH84_9CARY|nr:hypothetical protein Cgig2_015670 [Carnegiea gigantea]
MPLLHSVALEKRLLMSSRPLQLMWGAEEESRQNAFPVSNSIAQEVGVVTPSTVALVPQSRDFASDVGGNSHADVAIEMTSFKDTGVSPSEATLGIGSPPKNPTADQGCAQHHTRTTILGMPCNAKAHVGGTPSTAVVGAGPGAAVGAEVTSHQQQQRTPS